MGYKSSKFPISSGTHQGCPLSPLLFIIALEPLAEHICLNPDIRGLELAGMHHKLALFADNVLVYVRSPHTSLSNLLSLLHSSASLSGLQVNQTKSCALNVLLPDVIQHSLATNFSYHWSHSVSYLWINLTPIHHSLYMANYPSLIRSLTRLLELWDQSIISCMGRSHMVKMTLLPKLLYAF